MHFPIRSVHFYAASALLAIPLSVRAINIEVVTVGNPGNANDPTTRNEFGVVSYIYNIGKYEVTVGQYASFLNAVAAIDTYGLYHDAMALPNISAIARDGVPGSFSYSVIGSLNHPITHVGWADAARFANWLHNGQPTGAQNESTTEDGAYRLLGANSTTALIGVMRNANAKWFLPSENEWYKAAYHQPATQGGDSDNYWTYPMHTNSLPFSDQPPGATPANSRVANFFQNDGVANGYNNGYALTGSADYDTNANYLSDVGAYTSSPSFYGTFDQGGNVWEWNESESVVRLQSWRGIRGSSWANDSAFLNSGRSFNSNALNEGPSIGFRVATIPEPSTHLLAIIAIVRLLCRRGSAPPAASNCESCPVG